jgi:hypothetical protein
MKTDEAKSRIVAEWSRRDGKSFPPTWAGKHAFYLWLQREHPHLLAFRCSGDKWQRVHGWIGADDERA